MRTASKYTRPKGDAYITPKSIRSKKRLLTSSEFKETNNFVNLENPLSKKLYREYLKKAKNPLTFTKFKKTIKTFFVKLRKQLLNNEAGVFIKNFGYFCILKHPKPSRFNHKHTMGHKYIPTFIPIRSDSAMQTFTMDGTFLHFIRYVLRCKMQKGKKYKMAFTMLNNIYGTKQVVVYKKEDDNNQ